MLTKGKTSSLRIAKYALTIVALLAIVAMCFTACGKQVPTALEYVSGSLDKAEYTIGEYFDYTGAKVSVTYDNGKVEELDVTKEMVTITTFEKAGEVKVPVSFTQDGVTVTTTITVTVVDPYGAEKDAAISKITGNAGVTANKTDKGIDALIAKYTADVAAATSANAIDTLVAKFEADLAEWIAAKEAVLADIEAVDTSEIIAQYMDTIRAHKQQAITRVKAAATIDEAEDILADYEVIVAGQLAYQDMIQESEDEQSTLNKRKLDLAQRINAAIAKANTLKATVLANCTDQDIINKYAHEVTGEYTTAAAELEVLKYWVFITLTLDADDANVIEIERLIESIKTPIDKIYDLIKGGVTVLPAPYKTDDNGNYVLDTDNDVIGKLIADIDELIAEAEEMFTAAEAADMMADYYAENIAKSINLGEHVEELKDRYNELTEIQTEANQIDDLIAAIENTAEGSDARKAAIDAAWAALKTWASDNDSKALNVLENQVGLYNLVEYTDEYYGEYVPATVVDPASWHNYALDEAYIVKYFIPNINDLLLAGVKYDAQVVVKVINNIGTIIFTYSDATVDSNAEIVAAETAIAQFIAQYGEEKFEELCFIDGQDPRESVVAPAKEEYAARQAWAAEIIELINNLPSTIELGHYDKQNKGEEGALYLAYTEYLAFAEANTDDDDTIYTDVIAMDSATDADDTDNNEKALEAAVREYIRKKYAEQSKIQSDLIINAAFAYCMDNTDKDSQHALRQEILVAYNNAKATVAARAYVEQTNFVFNSGNLIDAELTDNLAEVTEMSEDLAAEIKAMID